MPTLLDLLYITLFAFALPAWDYLVAWPRFERRFRIDPADARRHLWRSAILYPWFLITLGAILWTRLERPWSDLDLGLPMGWRLWVLIALLSLLLLYYGQAAAAVARDSAARASVQRQFTGDLAKVLPRTRSDLFWFGAVSLSAGIGEEFLYRGFLLSTLSPWLTWWGAAALSLMLFAAGHMYQGWAGVIRTGVVGGLYTILLAALDSLLAVMAVHTFVDLGSGLLAWLTLRENETAAA